MKDCNTIFGISSRVAWANFAQSKYLFTWIPTFRSICPISHEVTGRHWQMYTFLHQKLGNCILHTKCRALEVEHVYLNFARWHQLGLGSEILIYAPYTVSPISNPVPRTRVQFSYPLGGVIHRHRMPSMLMLMAIIIFMSPHQYPAYRAQLYQIYSGGKNYDIFKLK